MIPTDTPTSWDERSTLLALYDYSRHIPRAKCVGLAPEHSWIETRFVGGPDLGPWTDEEPDKEFSIGAEVPIEQTLAEYDEQIARTDEIIAGLDLDDRSQTPRQTGESPTLRWVILHLIEENARHNGHIDILRELLDGTVGD